MTKKIIINSHIHVPSSSVDLDQALKNFHRFIFEDKHCKKCELKDDRPTDMCGGCEAFLGEYKMVKKSRYDGYLRFPKGRPDLIDDALTTPLDEHTIVDTRKKHGWKYPINWNEEEFPLYDYQTESVDKWLHHKSGILKSKPRTGKTVISTYGICKLGLKAIVIAHQDDLIKQFIETFHNFTDVQDVEKFNGVKLVAQPKTLKEFEECQVAVVTYQTFISKSGEELLRKVAPMFSVMVIDECHRASAVAYSRIIQYFSAVYELGLSATPIRKDGKDQILDLIIGDIFHETEASALSPLMRVYETGFKPKNVPKQWVYIMKLLERTEERNELIVQHAVSAIKAGRYVLIPLDFVNHINTITDMINREFDEPVAVAFNGKVKAKQRKELLARAKAGDWKCMVARRSMLTGVNIPILDCLIQCLPCANQYNYEQEINRVCTPMEKRPDGTSKPRPVVKYFVDEFDLSYHCFVIVSRAFSLVNVEFTEKSKPILAKIFKGKQKHLIPKAAKEAVEKPRTVGKVAFPSRRVKKNAD